MRIISYNVNGVRAAINKGLIDWLKTDPADVICLQETKASQENVADQLFHEAGYPYHYWYSAQKKGYSGVAVFSKIKPAEIQYGTGHEVSDSEGRVLQLQFGKVRLINAYFPSGTTGEIRQTYKYQWLNEMFDYLGELQEKYPKIVICGDYNIAHKEIDLFSPKTNQKTSGFLPDERLWMDKLLENGFIDGFRHINKEPQQYSWWSQRFPTVREQNKGWRLDYINVTKNLAKNILDAKILCDVKHSDHCPVYLDLKM
ncbi:MAG: exodeoxyribonuclease III [Chitinophagaceae bacterium]